MQQWSLSTIPLASIQNKAPHLRHLDPDALLDEVGPLGAIDFPGVLPRRRRRGKTTKDKQEPLTITPSRLELGQRNILWVMLLPIRVC